MRIVDRKTKKEVVVGQSLIRKDYKGFKHRYEILHIYPPDTVEVRKLTQGDRWVYLTLKLSALQLDPMEVV